MENNNSLTKNAAGQSTVEYILLLAVVSTLSVTLMRSDMINNLLSSDGAIGGNIKGMIEYSYRNGGEGRTPSPANPNYSVGTHPNYRGPDGTRFFGPAEAYPSGF